MAKQWVYLNTTAKQDLTDQLGREPDDDAVRARLGGLGLAMVRWQEAGLPVPPLFVIPAEASLVYLETGALPDGLWPQVEAGIHTLEARTGKTFGGTDNPLIVSVRGTPRHAMPGVMGGVRTLGLTPGTTAALAALSGDPVSTYRMYADAIVDFADAVHGVDRAQFDPVWEGRSDDRTAWDWRAVASACLSRYRDAVGEPFPQDPDRQLDLAIRAVFRQWESPRAVHYREHEDLPHAWGLGVAVASWVFGNLGADSGAGMVFSRHPVTGERALYGGFVSNALSYEAYASYDRLVPDGLASLRARYPQVYAQLADLVRRMETRERDAQHLEFVVEQGRLWVVAARAAKRSARAAVRIVRDMVDEGLISADEARDRLGAMEWGTAVTTDLDPEAAARARAAGRLLAQGTGVSAGAAVGAAAFDTETARSYAEAGRAYVLIVERTVPNDVPDVLAAEGLIMQAARPFTNGAFMCQGSNIPAVAYVPEMEIDVTAGTARVGDRVIHAGDVLTLDGLTGDIFVGPVRLTPSPVLQTLVDLWSLSDRGLP